MPGAYNAFFIGPATHPLVSVFSQAAASRLQLSQHALKLRTLFFDAKERVLLSHSAVAPLIPPPAVEGPFFADLAVAQIEHSFTPGWCVCPSVARPLAASRHVLVCAQVICTNDSAVCTHCR